MIRTNSNVISESKYKTDLPNSCSNSSLKSTISKTGISPASFSSASSAAESGTTIKSPLFHPTSKLHQQIESEQFSATRNKQENQDDEEVKKKAATHNYKSLQQKKDNNSHHYAIDEEHKSTIAGAVSNLVTAIVGCGIVGIPYALKQSGFVTGIVLIVITAVCNEKTLRLLISTAKHVHVSTYETAMEVAFGSLGFRFTALNMLIVAYGAMVSYLMMIRDTFSIVFGMNDTTNNGNGTNTYSSSILLVTVSCCVLLPISCQRDMADLARTSRISVVIDVFLVLIIAGSGLQKLYDRNNIDTAINAAKEQIYERIEHELYESFTTDIIHLDSIFIGLGVLSFAYVCQHAAFVIAGSLNQPTYSRWSIVTKSALSFCALLSLVCGIFGFLGYRDDTAGNVLNNLNHTSITATIARIMLGTTMLFVYPLECFVARHVLIVLFFKGTMAHDGNNDSTILNRADRRYALTIIIYICTLLPALALSNMGTVFALTGAIGGSCLSYIGPGILFLGIHGERFLHLIETSSWWRTKNVTNSFNSDVNCKDSVSSVTTTTEQTPLVKILQQQQQQRNRIDNQQKHPYKDTATGAQSTSIPFSRCSFRYLLQCCERRILCTMKVLSWYILGMPLWCAIARTGTKNVAAHMCILALKSPHPIRIGDVEYGIIGSGTTNTNSKTALATVRQRRLARQQKVHCRNTEDDDSSDEYDIGEDYFDNNDLVAPTEDVDNLRHGVQLQHVRRSMDHQISLPRIVHHNSAVARHEEKQPQYESSVLGHASTTNDSSLSIFPNDDYRSTTATTSSTFTKDESSLPAVAVEQYQSCCATSVETTTKIATTPPPTQPATETTATAVAAAIEPDPQHEPPNWYDFIGAVVFIVLGFIAMTAGLFSIQASGT